MNKWTVQDGNCVVNDDKDWQVIVISNEGDQDFIHAPDVADALNKLEIDLGPKCFCPGGGEPDGLNHRPGCPFA